MTLRFSSDGSLIAAGNGKNAVRLWDARTGAYKLTLAGMRSQTGRLLGGSLALPSARMIARLSLRVAVLGATLGYPHRRTQAHIPRDTGSY